MVPQDGTYYNTRGDVMTLPIIIHDVLDMSLLPNSKLVNSKFDVVLNLDTSDLENRDISRHPDIIKIMVFEVC